MNNEEEKLKEISIFQLKKVLEVFIKINKPVLIHSKPGIGKSTVIKDIAKEKGWEFIDIRPSQMPAEEIGGIPVPEKDEKTNLYRMIKALPAVYPIDENSKGILFLDELTTCREDVQNALLQLCQERALTGVIYNNKPWRLPKGWVIISACNDLDSNQYGSELSQPLNNRFAHIFLSSNPKILKEDFLNYAQKNNFNDLVISFLNKNYKYLYENSLLAENYTIYATPRTWEAVSDILNSYGDLKLKEAVSSKEFEIILRTLLSKDCTIAFLNYLQSIFLKTDVKTIKTKSFSQAIIESLEVLKNRAIIEAIKTPDECNNLINPLNAVTLNGKVTEADEKNIQEFIEEVENKYSKNDYGTFLISYLSFVYYSKIREENKQKLLLLLDKNEVYDILYQMGIEGRDFISSEVYKYFACLILI